MKYFVLALFIFAAVLAAAQTPTLTSITPNTFTQPAFPVPSGTTVTLNLSGKLFRSGMKVNIGTHTFTAKLKNQYAATVVVDTSVLNFAGDYQVNVNNIGTGYSRTVEWQICSPFTLLTRTLPTGVINPDGTVTTNNDGITDPVPTGYYSCH